jgi:hypothetical protein
MNIDQFITAIGIGTALVLMPMAVGVVLGTVTERNRWRSALVKRGIAQYNWMNAKWEWKNGDAIKGPPSSI